MLYKNYKEKIEKIAQKLKVLWKYRILIFSIILVALLSTGSIMVCKGTVIDEKEMKIIKRSLRSVFVQPYWNIFHKQIH